MRGCQGTVLKAADWLGPELSALDGERWIKRTQDQRRAAELLLLPSLPMRCCRQLTHAKGSLVRAPDVLPPPREPPPHPNRVLLFQRILQIITFWPWYNPGRWLE